MPHRLLPPPLTETAVPTLPPTETATEIPSATPLPTLTETPLPTATETPTLLPVPTASETATEMPLPTVSLDTETPPLQPSEAFTAEVTAEASFSPSASASPSPTGTGTGVETATVMPIGTATAVPTESSLPLVFNDNFDQGLMAWSGFEKWMFVDFAGNGFSLLNMRNTTPLQLKNSNSYNVSVEFSLMPITGTAHLSVRQSVAGSYTAALDVNGRVELYKSNLLLQSAELGLGGTWRKLRVSAVENVIRVFVDGTEALVYTDPTPLPSGTISLYGRDVYSCFFVDEFSLWDSALIASQPLPLQAASSNRGRMVPMFIPNATSIVAYADQGDIYILDPDASGMTENITNSPASEGTPQISHDGKKLIYVVDSNIYLMDEAMPNNPRLLVTNGGNPSWSFDDTKVAFNRSSDNEIYYIDAVGTNPAVRVTFNTSPDYSPTWSPDGLSIAYTSIRNNNLDIWQVNVTTGIETNLTPNSLNEDTYSPDYASDGRIALAYGSSTGYGIYIRNTNGTLQLVTPITGAASGAPDWSPDYSRLVYYEPNLTNGTSTIYKVNSNGSGKVALSSGLIPSWSNPFSPIIATPTPTITPTPTLTPSPTPVVGVNMRIETVTLSKPLDDQLQYAMNLLDSIQITEQNPYALLPQYYGVCNSTNKPVCAQYSYLMFYALIYKYTGVPPTLWDMFSSIYNRELGEFGYSRIALEALSRNFFDSQSGGCRYNSAIDQYSCTYSFITTWLGQTFWISDVTTIPPNIQVNVLSLFGSIEVIQELMLKRLPLIQFWDTTEVKNGIFAYDGFIFIGQPSSADSTNGINADLVSKGWRTGQGPSVPSRWGNKVIANTATNYTLLSGEYAPALITHVFYYTNPQSSITYRYTTKGADLVYGNDNGEQVDGSPGTQLTPPNCTSVALIVTSNAGFGTAFC